MFYFLAKQLIAGKLYSFNKDQDSDGNALLPVIYCYTGHQKQLLHMFETVVVRHFIIIMSIGA